MNTEPRYRPGRPPHDAVNGLRVGSFAGGVLGAIVVWILDVRSIWVVIAGALIGGAYGYFSQRRRSQL